MQDVYFTILPGSSAQPNFMKFGVRGRPTRCNCRCKLAHEFLSQSVQGLPSFDTTKFPIPINSRIPLKHCTHYRATPR